jgi:hypothetical protein
MRQKGKRGGAQQTTGAPLVLVLKISVFLLRSKNLKILLLNFTRLVHCVSGSGTGLQKETSASGFALIGRMSFIYVV